MSLKLEVNPCVEKVKKKKGDIEPRDLEIVSCENPRAEEILKRNKFLLDGKIVEKENLRIRWIIENFVFSKKDAFCTNECIMQCL